MKQSLKEVAQAGLVLGFVWIAKDSEDVVYLFQGLPSSHSNGRQLSWVSDETVLPLANIEILDYDHLDQASLLRLSEIVEGET